MSDLIVGLNYQQFEDHINAIKQYDIDTRKFEAAIECGFQDFFGICKIGSGLLHHYMALVKELMHDEGEWIEYWIYELEYGTRTDLGASYKDGTPIPLATIEDLYRLLCKNAMED